MMVRWHNRWKQWWVFMKWRLTIQCTLLKFVWNFQKHPLKSFNLNSTSFHNQFSNEKRAEIANNSNFNLWCALYNTVLSLSSANLYYYSNHTTSNLWFALYNLFPNTKWAETCTDTTLRLSTRLCRFMRLDAATTATLAGEYRVHSALLHRFSDEQAAAYELQARTRQFSCFGACETGWNECKMSVKWV